jgi:hypothetical protein
MHCHRNLLSPHCAQRLHRNLSSRSHASHCALVASACRTAQVRFMPLAQLDVSPEVAALQAQRYRQMTPAEKLARADAIWELAWDAVTTGVRLRAPDLDAAAVTRTARALFRRAAD